MLFANVSDHVLRSYYQHNSPTSKDRTNQPVQNSEPAHHHNAHRWYNRHSDSGPVGLTTPTYSGPNVEIIPHRPNRTNSMFMNQAESGIRQTTVTSVQPGWSNHDSNQAWSPTMEPILSKNWHSTSSSSPHAWSPDTTVTHSEVSEWDRLPTQPNNTWRTPTGTDTTISRDGSHKFTKSPVAGGLPVPTPPASVEHPGRISASTTVNNGCQDMKTNNLDKTQSEFSQTQAETESNDTTRNRYEVNKFIIAIIFFMILTR